MNVLGKFPSLLYHRRFQFWALFFFIILIRFLPFFQGKTLVFGDNYSLQVPGKIFVANWLKQGVLPLWNPYIFSGLSTEMMDANHSTLYPDTLFFVIFHPAVALNLTVITHLLIAYAGMYLLARTWLKDHSWSLVAAVLWMLSTQVTGSINNLALSPFPLHRNTSGKKLILVNLTDQAFGAYDSNGELVHWGPVSGGKGYCPDVGRACNTATGNFAIFRKQGPECISSKFPIETNGGAPMPYCMHFNGGFALHGSTLPGYNASHGCVRLFFEDAEWLNKHFANIGTRVIVTR